MPHSLDPSQIEVIDDAEAEVLRRMGGQRRLEMMNEMCRFGRQLMAARVRDQHPGWNTEQIEREVARRLRDAAA